MEKKVLDVSHIGRIDFDEQYPNFVVHQVALFNMKYIDEATVRRMLKNHDYEGNPYLVVMSPLQVECVFLNKTTHEAISGLNCKGE